MTLSGKFCEEDLWRILWRKNGFQWLQEKMQYTDFDLDSCLGKLEENPTHMEAAFSAFWGTYLANEVPPTLSDTQIGKAQKLLDYGSVPDNQIDKIKDLAYVKLHLAGLLAVCLIRPDWPTVEFPGVVSILKKALECYALVDAPEIDIDDPPSSGQPLLNYAPPAFSIILISGIARMELSRLFAERGEYEKALCHISDGAWDICATTIKDETGKLPPFVPYLPHSGRSFNIRVAMNIFEALKEHTGDVKEWGNVETCCGVLRHLGFFGLYDPDAWVYEMLSPEINLTFAEYWGKAETFAEERSRIVDSPYHVLTREDVERAQTMDRLKRDFFSDTWEELPGEAQKILVSAEIQWMNNRADNMVKDVRQLLELVLPSVFPLLEPAIRQSDNRLILTRMKDELLNNKIVRASIDSLKIDNADKTWAKDELPLFLQKVIDSRNYFDKDSHLPDKQLKRQIYLKIAVDIHSELLGIGCKGILPRLMRIKKTTRDKR